MPHFTISYYRLHEDVYTQSQTYSVSTGPKHKQAIVSHGMTPTHINPQPPTHSIHPVHASTSPHEHTPTLNAAHAELRHRFSDGRPLTHTGWGKPDTVTSAGRITHPEVLMSSVTHSYKQTLLNGGGSCVGWPFKVYRHLRI